MALSVATNTGALMAQAAASSVNKEMEVSMERLASGKRINGASDDAAGVAIASRLSSEIRGTNQAIRNAMDAQALIDTAEGAHDEIESILQRMRELAVQASNDTNNSSDRNNLQAEASALSTEINRIAATTSWAGENLLDATGGTSGTFEFQVGSRSSANDEISVSIGSMSASTLGVTAGAASTVGGAAREVSTNAIEVTGSISNSRRCLQLHSQWRSVELHSNYSQCCRSNCCVTTSCCSDGYFGCYHHCRAARPYFCH